MSAGRSCYFCQQSICFQEADRVGLKCGVSGREVHPAHKDVLSPQYQAELDLRLEKRAGGCPDFVVQS